MISLRRTPTSASFLVPIVSVCAIVLALPMTALAAPEGGEGESPSPQLAFEPGSYDFGLVEANRSNGQAYLQLRNNGAAPAQVYSLEIAGSGSGAFWTNGGDCPNRTLNPGETCSVQVGFGPSNATLFVAQLRANAEGGAVVSADLSGEGGEPRFTTATDPTNFGSVPVGSPGVVQTIDLTNSGNMPGGMFIAVIAGGAVGSFQLVDENCTGIPLSPAATCNLVVRFQPVSTGAKTARLGLFGDSNAPAQIILTGVGLDPEPIDAEDPAAGPETAATAAHKNRTQRKPRRGRWLPRHRRASLAARRALR